MTNTKNLANLAAALDDGTSGQVLQSTGSGGVQFADSSGSGVTTHTNQTAMVDADTASAYTEGSLHFDLNANVLYVKIGSGAGDGFYAVATVENAAPSITSFSENTGGAGANDLTNATPPNTFTLTAGSNTVITINATEPNLETISYSATVTSGTATDVFSSPSFPVSNQSSNVFTLTPATSGTGGTVTIRFDASDGTNIANVSHSFEIAFTIADSKYTSLLMATDNSSGDNDGFIDSSTNNQTLTPYNGPYAGTFSPYREGGYSAYFDGNDYLSIAHSTDLDLGTGNFTIEGWWRFDDTLNQNLVSKYSANAGFVVQYQSGNLRLVLGLGGSDAVYSFSWTPVAGTWYHVCILRDGTNGKAFINGAQIGSTTTVSTSNVGTTATLQIGLTHTVSEYTRGYVSDVRIVKGTAITPELGGPSARLITVSGTGYFTSLLTCHLPYFADGSSSARTITVYGNPETRPVGPYNYPEEYSEANNGGSIYFSTADNVDGSYITAGSYTLGATATINFWMYPTESTQKGSIIDSNGAGNSQNEFLLWFNPTLYIEMRDSSATYKFINSNLTFPYKVWTYVSLVREAEYIKFYFNGVLKYSEYVGTGQFPFTLGHTTYIGRRRYSDTFSPYSYWPYVGYLSDMQFIGGTAVTPTPSTVPTAPLSSSGTSLHIKGTDAHVLDKSQSANLKLVGGAVAVTSASSPTPPNNTNISLQNSVFLDGSGDCVSITPGYDDPIFNFGTHDWTIEVWAYFKNLTGGRALISFLRAGINEAVPHLYTDGGAVKYYVSGSDRISSATNALTLNTWHHVALSRNGNNHKIYVDGYQVGSTWTFAQTYVQGRPVLGDYHSSLNTLTNGTNTLHGYAQDFRITKGLARYTAADESSNIPSTPLKG